MYRTDCTLGILERTYVRTSVRTNASFRTVYTVRLGTVVYTVPSRAGRRNTRARPNQQSRSGRLEGIISYYLSRILRFENDVLVDIIS